ncbi:MAG: biotin carboxylase N-terminal domain-containing protein [Myxococcota bacterium]
MFETVLILRRGEAATRVARSCRRMGVTSVAIASKDEPASRHVDAADRTIEVELDATGAIPTDTLPRVFAEAEADAVHLGYQGQPQMWELASAAEKADLAVVGTDLDVLGALTDPTTLRSAAERAGVKVVEDSGAIFRPREVGVLVAADTHGDAIAIAECDRSLSVDDRVILHESPAPELFFRRDGEAFRLSLFESARRLACELRYAGLLEIRFQLDPDGRAWVLGVSIGLPRHHTLIEMVTKVDLVGEQLRIASGDNLTEQLRSLKARGHALATSIVAVDNADASVASLSIAPAPQGRVQSAASATLGLPLPADDRPLIAKLTTYDPIRHRALLAMDRILAELKAEPFETNVGEVRRILADYSFRAGQYDTQSVDRFVS